MKYRTEKGLMEGVNIQGSFAATCRLSDNSAFQKRLPRTGGHHLATVLLILISIGLGFGTAMAQAQIRAYVAHESDSFTASGTVSVIDTATNTVVATIPVGPIPFAPIGIAITPDGTRVYVTNAGDPFNVANGTVAVIDTATNTVVATIPVGILPEAVAITPDGTRAYVANTASSTASVIDIATNTVVATVAGLLDPLGVAITPDGTRAYVTNEGSASVSVIDTATNTVVTDIGVGSVPLGIAITPDGTRAYVADEANFAVSVIDTATNTAVAYIPDLGAFGVAITPDGTRAYVAKGPVSIIDTATNTVVATTDYRVLDSIAVAFTPDGTRAYATNAGNGFNNIPTGASIIDTATNTVVTNIPIPVTGRPIAIVITPAPQAPKNKEDCKQGGYLKFGPPAGPFKNQGQCVSYLEHH